MTVKASIRGRNTYPNHAAMPIRTKNFAIISFDGSSPFTALLSLKPSLAACTKFGPRFDPRLVRQFEFGCGLPARDSSRSVLFTSVSFIDGEAPPKATLKDVGCIVETEMPASYSGNLVRRKAVGSERTLPSLRAFASAMVNVEGLKRAMMVRKNQQDLLQAYLHQINLRDLARDMFDSIFDLDPDAGSGLETAKDSLTQRSREAYV